MPEPPHEFHSERRMKISIKNQFQTALAKAEKRSKEQKNADQKDGKNKSGKASQKKEPPRSG
ncbi:MAG: hypothetical protein HC843_04615 [Sphingomonadales bacterium]|nr:hypothetical protein [Sphingomonadales bacterium]